MSVYWNDGTSLYHYGIPGMIWGVRNGPPYPLGAEQKTKREKKKDYQDQYYEKSLKQKPKFSSKNKTKESKLASDIAKTIKNNSSLDSAHDSKFKKRFEKEITSILNDSDINDTKLDLESLGEEYSDYYKNIDKYMILAAIAMADNYHENSPEEIEDWIYYYMMDDGDQGGSYSIGYYLLDNNKSIDEHNDKIYAHEKKVDDVIKAKCDNMLGKYANQTVKGSSGTVKTVSQILYDPVWSKYWRDLYGSGVNIPIDSFLSDESKDVDLKNLEFAKQYLKDHPEIEKRWLS